MAKSLRHGVLKQLLKIFLTGKEIYHFKFRPMVLMWLLIPISSCKAALEAIPNDGPSDSILPTENESSSKSESSHDLKDEL